MIDARGDQQAEIEALGGVDVALVTVPPRQPCAPPTPPSTPTAAWCIVGLPADDRLELPVFETVLKGISVIGSLVGTRNDLAESFDLHARGLTRVVTESRRLEDVNACFEEVLAGEVPARLVFEM